MFSQSLESRLLIVVSSNFSGVNKMFFRTPRFIRRWLRARMHPMAEKDAWSTKQKLSVAYMIIAWHCFGFVLYQMYNGNKHWPVTHGLVSEDEYTLTSPGYYWAKKLGIKKAEVYRVGSFGITPKEVIDETATSKTAVPQDGLSSQ